MKNIYWAATLLALCLGLWGCGTGRELYSWYNYENASYAFSKKHTEKDEAELIKAYEKIIDNQSGMRQTVPPGVYAEYGYLLAKSGKVTEGVDLMQKEIDTYPESRVFIDRIIKQFKR
ncbi:DUF4810 domain-containing protein [Porphyromonas pogonae]|uniref:DUF4810 domain-containing protein n=1 Tax=Porphyromonas pogonae TaxID=867595 RepID=UPI002E781612|nr:DUF4810 domain-containing protein [Porphyromonas pogonae]